MDKKFRLNAILAILFVLFNSIIGFIKIPIVINTFGHFENGFYTKLLTLTVTFKIVDLGITSVLNATVSRYYFQKNWTKFNYYLSMARKLYNRLTIAAMCLLIGLALILPLVEKSYLYHGSYFQSAMYIFIIFLPNAVYFYKSHYLILIYCYKESSRIELANFITSCAVFAAIIISKFSLHIMFEVIIITTILTLSNDIYWKYRYYKKAKKDNFTADLDVKIDKELLSNSKYSSILVSFSNVSRALNYSIIAHFYANEMVSHYTSIMVYIQGINLIFVNTLLGVTYNTFLEYNSNRTKKELSEVIKIHTILQQFIIVIVVGGMFSFFPSFLRIVGFMPQNIDLRPYIIIAGLEMYLWWAMMRFNHLAYIQKRFKKMIIPFTLTTVLNIVLSVVFTQIYGPYGVLLGSIVQWIFMYIFLNWLVHEQFLNDFLRIIKGLVLIFGIYFIFNKIFNLQDLEKIHNIFKYIIVAGPRVVLFTIVSIVCFVLTEKTILKKIGLFIAKILKKNTNK